MKEAPEIGLGCPSVGLKEDRTQRYLPLHQEALGTSTEHCSQPSHLLHTSALRGVGAPRALNIKTGGGLASSCTHQCPQNNALPLYIP